MEKGLQTLNQQRKLALWGERVTACRSSGQTVKTWCEANNINIPTYYKWQKRLFGMAISEEPQFVEVAMKQRSSAVAILHVQGVEVELATGIDEETLRVICRVLRTC